MRDFRDAKVMAQGLREALSVKEMAIGHGEALEIVSKMFGVADWNTLSARINKVRGKPDRDGSGDSERRILPALPIKDTAPFPTIQLPLWIRRPQTVQALSRALASGREVALVAQKDRNVENPNAEDVYEIGVLARVLDVGSPSDATIARAPTLEGSTQILLQTQARVRIRDFTGKAGQFEAEVEPINEGPIQSAPELIEMPDRAGVRIRLPAARTILEFEAEVAAFARIEADQTAGTLARFDIASARDVNAPFVEHG